MNYISLYEVLDEILDNNLLKGVTLERAVRNTVSLIRLIGAPTAFEEKVTTIDIHQGRGVLPCDCYDIIGVKDKYGAYRYTTDTFHNQRIALGIDRTYKRLGNFIFLSTDIKKLDVAYTAFKTDDKGLPMIPDDESFKLALYNYIKLKRYTELFEEGKITPAVLLNVQTEYAWYVGLAQVSLVRLNPDLMESITGMLNQLVTRKHEHTKSFATLGSREMYKNH